MKNNRVQSTLFLGNGSKTYLGRLLGLINDIELQGILKKKGIKGKLIRAEGTTVKEIAKVGDDVNGMRILMVVDTVDKKAAKDKFLYVSQRIHSLSYTNVTSGSEEIGIQFNKVKGEEDNWLVLSGE